MHCNSVFNNDIKSHRCYTKNSSVHGNVHKCTVALKRCFGFLSQILCVLIKNSYLEVTKSSFKYNGKSFVMEGVNVRMFEAT